MRLLLVLLLAVWSGPGEAADPEKRSVRVDVQIVAIDPRSAITLIPELQRAETADRAIAKIQAMVDNEQAELLAWPSATAASGGRATSEGGEEMRYPDYWPTLPSIGSWFGAWAPPAISTYQLPYYLGHHLGEQTPTSFDTRVLGPVLVFAPTISENGSSIVLENSVGDVEFGRSKEFRGTPSPAKIAGTLVISEFRARTTHPGLVNVQPGTRMLLSSFVEQRPKPRVVLYLLRAQVIGAKTSQPK